MELLRPLLAAKMTDAALQRLKYPLLLSPKIDGIRALVRNGQLVSRTMKLIPNAHTQALFGRPELEGLDGELVVGNPWDKNLMQQTTSGVMSHGGKPDVTYYVFDRWDMPDKFYDRWKSLEEYGATWRLSGHPPGVPVRRVAHELVPSYEHMILREMFYTKCGYEGIMLRSLDGRYKQNRSTLREGILLKVKRFHDAEAIVTGSVPLFRNDNEAKEDERGYTKRSSHQANKVADDLLGALLVRCNLTGQEFSIGSGFTEAQRRSLWNERKELRGRIVKYKCFNVTGVKYKPRFPIFLGFRDPRDM